MEQDFVLRDWGGPPIRVATYRPARWHPDSPVVIALHGVNRNVPFTLRTWRPLADRHGFLLVVPEFDQRHFPQSRYNLGDVTDGHVPAGSSYNAIEPLFREVRQLTGSTRTGYRLFGHSAGAQFVHRFLWLHPEAPVERAVISMAGWYTLPDRNEPWPYGLGGLPLSRTDLARLLATDVMVQVGEYDNDPEADNLRRGEKADAQGTNRFDRGRYFFSKARQVAQRSSLPFGWVLQVASGAGHESDVAAEDSVYWLADRQIAGRVQPR